MCGLPRSDADVLVRLNTPAEGPQIRVGIVRVDIVINDNDPFKISRVKSHSPIEGFPGYRAILRIRLFQAYDTELFSAALSVKPDVNET